MKQDRLIQGMAADGDFRIIAVDTTHTVETARIRFDLSPLAADALGRAMTGAILLARLLEKTIRDQRVTLRFDGGGPLGLVIAEGTIKGEVRGYVGDPQVVGPESVGEAVGMNGTLTVVRGVPPDGAPYSSKVELASGEIASDIAQYLALSEQIASAVLIGVYAQPGGITAAGGMIIQAFPHTTEEEIATLEERVREAPTLSTLLARMPIEEAVAAVLVGMDYKPLDASFDVPIRYHCHCTRDRAYAPLSILDRKDLEEMIREGGTEIVCQFCNEKYTFTPEELRLLTRPADA